MTGRPGASASSARSASSTWSAREIALAGLVRISEPPVAAALGQFVEGVGAEEAWQALITRAAPDNVLASVGPRLQGNGRAELLAQAQADLDRAAEVGARITGPGDQDWPADCFEQLQWVPPYDDCRRAWSPVALYRRGPAWPVAPGGAIAIVGSRAATSYGVHVATELAADAIADGYTVVSGAAFGIDAAAHRGSLSLADGPGVTVAVLACGIDRAYPVAHRSLIDAVGQVGGVVSEYPPGGVPARHRFLVRNRIIAAFAELTVVVEAGRRSGSLNTATTAGRLGRTVAAIPGPVTSALSMGCHELVRDGKASLVGSWRDVRQLLGPIAVDPVSHRRGSRPTDGLDLITGRVHEALPARGAASVDALSAEADMPAADVIGALATLHVRGLAVRQGGLWSRAHGDRAPGAGGASPLTR